MYSQAVGISKIYFANSFSGGNIPATGSNKSVPVQYSVIARIDTTKPTFVGDIYENSTLLNISINDDAVAVV